MNKEANNSTNNEVNDETQQKKSKLIITLGIAILIAAIILTIALIGVVSKGKETQTESIYELTSSNGKVTQTEEVDLNALFGETEGEASPQQNSQKKTNKNNSNKKTTKNKAVEYYERLSPNGENKLSDHFENKYIKKVSGKYNIDTDLLVAIYSEPNTGNNFVLQFKDKRDAEGNVVKSPDNLEKVYHIDKKGNITIATGTEKGNVGVSYGEGMMVFNMIKTIVMKQYPDYFVGV